jgi:hypothetical protein
MNRIFPTVLTLNVLILATAPAAAAADKIPVKNAEDLPRHTYEVSLKPSEILTADGAFADLASRVKSDIENVLATYDVQDPTTLKGYYQTLTAIALIGGDYDRVVELIEKSRPLEEKEAQKLMMGQTTLAYIETRSATPAAANSEEFGQAFEKRLGERLADIPWDPVQDIVQQLNAQLQIVSEGFLVGMISGSMDPAVEKSGFLSGDQAEQLVKLRSFLDTTVPYKAHVLAAVGSYMASHREAEKPDIWADRSVELPANGEFAEVLIGVWDSGVDTDVFGDHMYRNPGEVVDGEDNDGNGFVDDVHGIAFDLYARPTPELLYTADDVESKRVHLEQYITGIMDLQAGIESEAASGIRERMSGLEQEEVTDFLENMSLYAHYAHGTHVAGISSAGNPYARILAARMSFDHRVIPIPFTEELARDWAAMFQQFVAYFKAAGVRVVNMSWGFNVKEIENTLEKNGIGSSAEERGEMAREMFAVCRGGLLQAFQSAPDICFIASAGNSDNDVQFDEFIPSGFELPNLMTVGAVDQAGEATGFTSFGENVVVYANGFEVLSDVPGGNRIKMSGTSMSSPNVTNLAAKILAVNPTLKPVEVFALIQEGADDRGGGDQALLVINPRRSLELLRERMSKSEE